MDDKDCTLQITCEKAQESDGDELYVRVIDAEGNAKRVPADKKCFQMQVGAPAASFKAHQPRTVELYEEDAMTPDDHLGTVHLTAGEDGSEVVEGDGARYVVRYRWF